MPEEIKMLTWSTCLVMRTGSRGYRLVNMSVHMNASVPLTRDSLFFLFLITVILFLKTIFNYIFNIWKIMYAQSLLPTHNILFFFTEA